MGRLVARKELQDKILALQSTVSSMGIRDRACAACLRIIPEQELKDTPVCHCDHSE